MNVTIKRNETQHIELTITFSSDFEFMRATDQLAMTHEDDGINTFVAYDAMSDFVNEEIKK